MKVTPGHDGRLRCSWCSATAAYEAYHDTEWGFPVADDRRLFEKLCLEGFQAGLSWRTVLEKRQAFRDVFHHFDPQRIALFDEGDVTRLLGDTRIIRHRGKIEAVINNARLLPDLIQEEGSLAAYVWRYAAPPLPVPEMAATSAASVALSKDLRKRSWKFVGPTTVHAFMQAMGLINDHAPDCVIRDEAAAARAAFAVPRKKLVPE